MAFAGPQIGFQSHDVTCSTASFRASGFIPRGCEISVRPRSQRPARVLVGVLSSGEPSIDRVLGAIQRQTDVDVEVFHVADLPQWEAHERLIRTFDERGDGFDLLTKVDADMELVHPRLLWALGESFKRFPKADLIEVGVDDWMSGTRILGLKSWRGGTRWTGTPPDLFTDYAPTSVRQTLSIRDAGFPLILHAVDPSPEQALRYGAHRALKAASEFGLQHEVERIDALERLVEVIAAAPEPSRVLALIGIITALTDPPSGRRLVDTKPSPRDVETALARAGATALEALCSEARSEIADLRLRASRAVGSTRDSEPAAPDRGDIRARLRDVLRRARDMFAARRAPFEETFLALLDVRTPERGALSPADPARTPRAG